MEVAREWTEEELLFLLQQKAGGATDKEIGLRLGRSSDSVESKRRRLHSVISDEQIQEKSEIRQSYPEVKLRSAVFDIETTDFSAGGINSHLVCVCILPLDSDEIQTIQIEYEDRRDDRRVLAEALEALSQYDIWIGHYITGFDINFLRSRMAYHHLCWDVGRVLTYDTYFAAKRCSLRSERKSLAFLVDFFRLQDEKTSIYPVTWSHIDSPNQGDFTYTRDRIVSHCHGDVRMNKELFHALWPLDRSMTSLPVYKK